MYHDPLSPQQLQDPFKGEKKRKSRRGDHIVESKAETLTIDVEMLEQKLEREKPSSSDN